MSADGENLIRVSNTVFALSTPVGGAIAVIRATGPLCLPVLESIFSGKITERLLSWGRISDGEKVLDEIFAKGYTQVEIELNDILLDFATRTRENMSLNKVQVLEVPANAVAGK